MKAYETVEKAYEAIERHPEFWNVIEGMAARDYADGERMSVKRYVETARWQCRIKAADGERAGVANALQPAFSRILVRRHPQYAPYVHMARSGLDRVFADEGVMRELEGGVAE